MPVPPVLADEGFHGPTKEVFQPPHWFDVDLGPIDFYLNKATALGIFAALVVGVLFWLGFRRAAVVPRGVQNVCESVYDFVDTSIARDVIGENGRKYTPYLVVLFSFVLISNVLAIVPGAQFPPTSRIAIPIVLSAITYVLFNHAGIKASGAKAYFGHMINPAPSAPFFVKLLLGPIEVMSNLIVRPFTLAVRLFANMFAGHILLLVFSLGAEYLLPKPPFVFGVASLLMTIVLTGFELVIDGLQAYIITILTAAFIAGAVEEHGDEHDSPHPVDQVPAVSGASAAAHA
ncbi:ATP synthase subunit a [Candidatus Protofrankia californiensis]|uniref:ATP synthase subunit a n=1 Tax=Candidatus Protofrankia californiensis TaxID=1839754 RepID=A0A1C3PFC1_9ACTN|nr:ATP synthase subunit a [Candidatus Protofrankia californiensis]